MRFMGNDFVQVNEEGVRAVESAGIDRRRVELNSNRGTTLGRESESLEIQGMHAATLF